MKTLQGKVISGKMAKTVVVLIERKFRHPFYGKIVSKKKKVHAANDLGAKEGQTVILVGVRPIAKTVSFKVAAIVGETPAEPEEKKAPEEKKIPKAVAKKPVAKSKPRKTKETKESK